MKLFIGFELSGKEVRWQEPNIARGRPEGFWQETGHWVYGQYDMPTTWFGSFYGLATMRCNNIDANGHQIFGQGLGDSWEGVKADYVEPDGLHYQDIWMIDDAYPDEVEVEHGLVRVLWDRFTSSFECYMSSIGQGQYMKRSESAGGIRLPLTQQPQVQQRNLIYTWS